MTCCGLIRKYHQCHSFSGYIFSCLLKNYFWRCVSWCKKKSNKAVLFSQISLMKQTENLIILLHKSILGSWQLNKNPFFLQPICQTQSNNFVPILKKNSHCWFTKTSATSGMFFVYPPSKSSFILSIAWNRNIQKCANKLRHFFQYLLINKKLNFYKFLQNVKNFELVYSIHLLPVRFFTFQHQ